jgi:hypothetical protein
MVYATCPCYWSFTVQMIWWDNLEELFIRFPGDDSLILPLPNSYDRFDSRELNFLVDFITPSVQS